MELYGRKTIYSEVDEVNAGNILNVLNDALPQQSLNAMQERYLLDYYKGKQEIRNKTKQTRPEINHVVTENRCYAITDFKTGYICGDPIVYTSRVSDRSIAEQVTRLNNMMEYEDKSSSDKELFDWMHITGHGYRIILPDSERDDVPFEMTVLPPMNTMVIYSNKFNHKPLAGIYITRNNIGTPTYSVYTPREYIEVYDQKIVKVEPHALGVVPIFEFPLNEARLGSFEPVLTVLDAINYVDSDRLDGITSFINSLCVLYNAELPEGQDGNTIREQGLICLKSVGENKADIKIMTEQLDQNAAQTLKEDLYNTVLQIVGMPYQGSASTSDSSNNGAMFLKQGYQLAETRAKGEELQYKKVNKEETKLILSILENLTDITLKPSDIDITFTRKQYADINSKANVLTMLLNNDYVSPIDAWEISGITSDPEEACNRGLAWKEEKVETTSVEAPQEEMTNENEKPTAD